MNRSQLFKLLIDDTTDARVFAGRYSSTLLANAVLASIRADPGATTELRIHPSATNESMGGRRPFEAIESLR